jgi:hypothetical protein
MVSKGGQINEIWQGKREIKYDLGDPRSKALCFRTWLYEIVLPIYRGHALVGA